MRRTFWSLLLVIGLLCQTIAFAGLDPAHRGAGSAEGGVSHEVLHLTGQAHHHHDDDFIHLDESTASLEHLHGDCLSSPAFILPFAQTTFPPVAMHTVRPPLTGGPLPQPFVEGPRRPPRHSA